MEIIFLVLRESAYIKFTAFLSDRQAISPHGIRIDHGIHLMKVVSL